MDRDTRNRIQRATQAARGLLEREYGEQLEGIFDIRLDGTIASEPGGHLSAAERILWQKLVAAVEHRKASGLKNVDAVGAYLREAAFTTFNRFVALKMLGARGLVQECISRGDQSSGFREFTGLAPGLVQLADHGYRLYLESLFDEIGREVRVLFDRRDPAGLLWPRRQALLDLLAVLNDSELAEVWKEDETIGWVYQYFNSDDERRKMRAESQAPRNSRELAVRNQFFTPRYVVEFLTDNTLGRIWYEMRQSQTRLAAECQYLVRRPREVFLAEGEQAPADNGEADDNFGQEELLNKTVYIPYRAKKDPRDLKVLDPACGSGHFLLYAFDLLLTIYEEAWEDADSPKSEVTDKALREDFGSLAELRAAMPGLILRHNLHGIDIDPRCAQIAALALWIRSERAYNDFRLSRGDRPAIAKTNIVVAEPMPGEKELRAEFIASLDKPLGQLVERVFEKMELAGEAGSLLKIEDEIKTAIRDVYREHGELFQKSDEERWWVAEARFLEALRGYVDRAQNGRAYRRRLFSEDAARGLAFIDICRQRYDVVLMNPPFGDPPATIAQTLASDDASNLYCAFVRWARASGASAIGCITDRTFTTQSTFKRFREDLLENRLPLSLFLDLGWGVLDANVQVAAYVLSGTVAPGQCAFLDGRLDDEKADLLRRQGGAWRWLPYSLFADLPESVLSYALPLGILQAVESWRPLNEVAVLPRGLGSNKAARTYRAWVEVPITELGRGKRWEALANGGEFAPFWRQDLGVADWRSPTGRVWVEMAAEDKQRPYDQSGTEHYFLPGLSFPKQSSSFNVALLPAGFLPTREGKAILPKLAEDAMPLLAFLSSRAVKAFVRDTCGLHKQSGPIGRIPVPEFEEHLRRELAQAAETVWRSVFESYIHDETSRWFIGPVELAADVRATGDRAGDFAEAANRIDQLCCRLFSLDPEDNWLGPVSHPVFYRPRPTDTLSWAVGVAFSRFGCRMLSFRELPCDPLAPPRQSSPVMLEAFSVAAGLDAKPVTHVEVLCDDSGHSSDIAARVIAVLRQVDSKQVAWIRSQQPVESEDEDAVRLWLRSSFFDEHISRYTIARRRAPIYWQLATPSARYSVWLYYQRFTKDTFYKVLNDYVTPKLQHEERKLLSLVQTVGRGPTASQRKEIAEQEAFVEELRVLREEVARIAPLWNPDLNDGAILNFAPLWRLVPQHRVWQKECKACWDRLVAGEYIWTHLAMHLWPERVVPKCAEDRSLAIAHGLEEVFWVEGSDGKWQPRKVDKATVDKLIVERTSPAVKDALESLLSAPSPGTSRGSGQRLTNRGSSPRSSRLAGADSRRNGSAARRGAAPDDSVFDAVKQAIAAAEDGASKADIIGATGLTDSQWNAAISVLLAQRVVTKTGERRAARYHLVKTGGES